MENFAEQILEEKDLTKKMEMTYYLSKKTSIFFDASVIIKAELAKMFIQAKKLNIDMNVVLTAVLLYACKKPTTAQNLDKIRQYPKKSSNYLSTIGFNEKFCEICEGHNRYSEKGSRNKESDILELVDQFGGMLLNRPERIGFKADEALCLLTNRNLKGKDNKYISEFEKFAETNGAVSLEEEIYKDTPFTILQAIGNRTQNKIVPRQEIEDEILEAITRISIFEEWYESDFEEMN